MRFRGRRVRASCSASRIAMLSAGFGSAGPWAGAALAAAAAGPAPSTTCFPATAADGPGAADPAGPFRPTLPEAARLNLEGKRAYRSGLWEVAREHYRAAEAADPDFLAPALNVACSFVRQERFDEATAEVVRLVGRAYLPWRDEVLAAADLGALKVRPQWQRIEAAFEESRQRWADELPASVLFIARTRPPLGLGARPSGVFLLSPRQEVFAWSPRTLRTRQITSEEGRVLAMLPARGQRRLAYVVADKLLREDGRSKALRGVTAVVLDLEHLRVLGRRAIEGDVRSLVVAETSAGFSFRSLVDAATPVAWRFEHGAWTLARESISSRSSRSSRAYRAWPGNATAATEAEVELLPTGVGRSPLGERHAEVRGGAEECGFRAWERVSKNGVRGVEVAPTATPRGAPTRRTWSLGSPENAAGLFGLALP